MSSTLWAMVGVCLFLFLTTFEAKAQNEPAYDEISVFFQVQNIGGFEIPALIKNEQVLLPIKDIFDILKIKCTISANRDSIAGFLTSPDLTYLIDYKKNIILFQGKQFTLQKDDLIRTDTNLYLYAKYFGEIFGMDCKFDVRNLSVNLSTKLELPVIREMRIEQMRQNISRMKGEMKADTLIKRSRPVFHFGMADWSVVSTQNIGQSSDTRLNLALGSAIAGGEANVFLNYATNEKFDERLQQYYLKFVNNDRSYLRQTTIGKIATDATSSLYDPVVGIRLSNTPTTYRQAFGTYPLSDYTNPGWMVELYVNNVLVDYAKADASGFFTFQVPLVYGNSLVKLKYYGPWGEERAKEQTIVVPFNFLPAKEFNYTLNAGMVEDGKGTIFSRGSMNYGVNKSITLGAGVEYLSSITSDNILPFVTLATRPLPNMLLSGEITYGVRGKGILSYQFPKNIHLELNYSKFVPGQTAINSNYLEERKVIFSIPFKSKGFSMYNRMSYDQILLPGTDYSTAEWLISGAVLGINTNLTNYAMFTKDSKPYAYSDLSLSFRMRGGLTFIPQMQYEYSSGALISAKGAVEKYLFNKGFVSLSYENNFKSNQQVFQLGLRYDLPFAQTGFTARQANGATTLMELARGSLIVDTKSHYVGANNRANVGKGGIIFAPFLDINCNYLRDTGEPKAYGLNIRINGGNTVRNDRDSTVIVTDLEPYTNYLVELDPNSFDNVAWKLLKKSFKIEADPNQMKLVEIPVAVVGEVSGTINKLYRNEPQGFGRITLNIFNKSGTFVGKTMTEQDGYFSYLGLVPGRYYAQVDTVQLKKIHYNAEPDALQFAVKGSRDGDVVDGIDFTLKSTFSEVIDSTKEQMAIVEDIKTTEKATEPSQDTKVVPQQNIINQPITSDTDQIFLQVAAFRNKKSASELATKLSLVVNFPVGVTQEDGWYKVRFGAFTNNKDAALCKYAIVSNGILAENLVREIRIAKTEKAAKAFDQTIAQQAKTPAIPATVPTTTKPAAAKPEILPATQPATQPTATVPPTVAKESPAKTGTDIVVTREATQIQDIATTTDTDLNKHYYVQISAFIDPKNSTGLIKSISNLLPYTLGIVYREHFYKVRYGPFHTLEEVNECIRRIVQAGIMTRELLNVVHEVTGVTILANQLKILDGYQVQVGAFRDKLNASRYFKKMSAEYPFPIMIINEDNYSKVRFGTFAEFTEMNKCYKTLINNNVNCFMRSKSGIIKSSY